ncbi:hypothetical protein EVJ58_g3383 [Rhodofomes roseus]|uniref:Uncharacterized protein n=1 Tax=Rhodofomes roseus TaxID=34475 RepID=A0A4Y9YN40_9APHY|nr:hypothetical protein EVJ58_g3383 [Rhodofomes roseus]
MALPDWNAMTQALEAIGEQIALIPNYVDEFKQQYPLQRDVMQQIEQMRQEIQQGHERQQAFQQQIQAQVAAMQQGLSAMQKGMAEMELRIQARTTNATRDNTPSLAYAPIPAGGVEPPNGPNENIP